MTYQEYIEYHLRGDAGVEERMIASLAKRLRLSDWESFALIYYYSMTYHIPSALRLLFRPDTSPCELKFRTDRRWVRYADRFNRLKNELSPSMLSSLRECKTTKEAYENVRRWFFFGRYAAFLLLEVYVNCFSPRWVDDLTFEWEKSENYTIGAMHIAGSDRPEVLDALLSRAKSDTQDNSFAIETSLCAVAKFIKGTRWDGYYTERMLKEANESQEFGALIYECL